MNFFSYGIFALVIGYATYQDIKHNHNISPLTLVIIIAVGLDAAISMVLSDFFDPFWLVVSYIISVIIALFLTKYCGLGIADAVIITATALVLPHAWFVALFLAWLIYGIVRLQRWLKCLFLRVEMQPAEIAFIPYLLAGYLLAVVLFSSFSALP
jgi:hypothetical protein